MTKEEVDAVFALLAGERTEEEFLRTFPVDPRADGTFVGNALSTSHDEDELEAALALGFRFGLFPDWAPALCRLLVEPWHHSHEDVALALEELRDPSTVDCLYEAALMKFGEEDEFEAFAVKCIWALYRIGTPEARVKLELLAQSDNPIVHENARARLAS